MDMPQSKQQLLDEFENLLDRFDKILDHSNKSDFLNLSEKLKFIAMNQRIHEAVDKFNHTHYYKTRNPKY